MKPRMWFLACMLWLLAMPVAVAADLIVDAQFVADAYRRGALLWDARGAEDYAKGHLPGAVNIDDPLRVLRDENSEDFIGVEEIEQALGAAGIDPQREVVVYAGRGSPAAYFALYTLDYFGAERVHIFHGGVDEWRELGGYLTTDPVKPKPVVLKLKRAPRVTVDTDEVLSRLIRDASVQILDVRTPAEYAGVDVRAIRGGHIPRAVNIPFEQNWVDPDTPKKLAMRKVADNRGMALKPMKELQELYSRLNPKRVTIVYCQSGARASESAAVLRHLGFDNVRIYDTSWLGYASRLDAPAENENFLNLGRLKSQLRSLGEQVHVLQGELDALRKQMQPAAAIRPAPAMAQPLLLPSAPAQPAPQVTPAAQPAPQPAAPAAEPAQQPSTMDLLKHIFK